MVGGPAGHARAPHPRRGELFNRIQELCAPGERDRLIRWGDRTIADANVGKALRKRVTPFPSCCGSPTALTCVWLR